MIGLGLRNDVYRRPLMTALDRLGLGAGWRCVDVGAGGGDVSVALAEMVGREGRVYAVDSDPHSRDQVAGRAAAHSQVVAITQAGEDLLLPEPVDLAFCRFLLMHVADPVVVLRRMGEAAGPERPLRAGAGPERPLRAGAGPERPLRAGAGPERPVRAGDGPERPDGAGDTAHRGWVVAQEPITSGGRVGGRPLSAPEALRPDVGAQLPSLVREAGLEIVDAWAESQAGAGPGPVAEYLAQLTGVDPGDDPVVLPPLVTVIARPANAAIAPRRCR